MLRISLKQFVPVIIMAAGLLLFGTNLCNAQSGNSSGGVYKTEFTNIPDSAYQIGGKTLGTHCVVKRISLGEPSTGEIMADFSFPDGVNTASYTTPNDKVQYWVERVQDATGKTVALKVSSTAANIPYLNLTMYSADGELPELNIYGLKPDGNVVYSPDGSALSKPYEDPALKIGGFKELRFKAEKYDKGVKAKEMVEKAGYETASARYEDKVYSFGVHSTQDGRAKIERDVLKKKYWFPVKSETEGNRGLYELRDTLDLNIESHSNEETVKTQKIKIQGSISNPAGEFDKVTKIQIVISNGTDKKDLDATLTGDSTFTAEFAIDTFTVSVESNDNVLGNVTGAGVYDYNSLITISAIANNHYHFSRWSDGNTENPRNILVTRDSSFVAIFEIDSCLLQLSSNNTQMGYVNGSGTYSYNSLLELTAVPKIGHHFVQWNDGSVINPRTITLTQDSMFIALFAVDTFMIAVESSDIEMGLVNGSGKYAYNNSVQIEAIPNEGFEFVKWNDNVTLNPRMILVTQDSLFTAEFQKTQTPIQLVSVLDGVFVSEGQIIVEGYEDEMIYIYNSVGQCISITWNNTTSVLRIRVPYSGVYLVKIANKVLKVII